VPWEQTMVGERKRKRHGLRVIFVLAPQGSLWQPEHRLSQSVAEDQKYPS
jgi:hypothetical protein